MSVKVSIPNFSIEQICNSGQCFRMNKLESGEIEVIANGRYLTVSQDGDNVCFYCSEEDYDSIWKPYFDIDQNTDYTAIIKSIDKEDTHLTSAAEFGGGIRILNQDLFEMIISFIISQRNNIKRIKSCIRKLSERFGEKKIYIDSSGKEIIYYDFPTPQALYNADIEDIKALGVGYRDAYIKKAAQAVIEGTINFEEIKKMSYQDAKEELLTLYGVGNKVADCICLFALHHIDAFPMDTHIISIVNNKYNGEFPFDKYEGYAGVLQQYLFYFDL